MHEERKFQKKITSYGEITAVSAPVWQRCASNISLNLGQPSHDSITTVDGCLLKVIGRFPFEAHVIEI